MTLLYMIKSEISPPKLKKLYRNKKMPSRTPNPKGIIFMNNAKTEEIIKADVRL